MAQKAAIILILDVGYSEYFDPEDGENFIKTARECASRVIQSKIFTQSKDEVGVILSGCDYDGSSENIHVAAQLSPPSWHSVRQLNFDHNKYRKANWIDAVIRALDLLRSKAGKFSERKIVVFSSNLETSSYHQLTDMEHDIEDLVVDLLLIHPKITEDPQLESFNDEIKRAMSIVERVNGTSFSIDQAADLLLSFQKKKVNPRPWNICLDIGSKIKIPVSGFKKMNESQSLKWKDSLSAEAKSLMFPSRTTAPTYASQLAAENPVGSGIDVKFTPENLMDSGIGLQGTAENPIEGGIKLQRIAENSFESGIDSQRTGESPIESSIAVRRALINLRSDGTEVDKSEMIEGYHFGSDMVPFTKVDSKEMQYKSGPKCLSVVKVTKKKFVPRHYWIDNSCTCIVARNGDEDAAIAFSALVQALDQIESVAIVRKLYFDGKNPHMGALFPVIKPKKEFLVFIPLPFSNYMRKCILPELKVDHLTSQQFNAIDQLIDKMDLSTPGDNESESDNRQWSDLLVPHKVFDPYLQYVRTCVASRVLNPSAPLPEMSPKLYKMLTEPPQIIKEAVSDTLAEISQLFPNLGPKSDDYKKGRGKRGISSKDSGEGDGDISDDELPKKQIKEEISIKEEEREIVGLISPVEDFRIAISSKTEPFSKVCQQMQHIIIKLVLNSFELVDFEKPKGCLKALRHAVLADDVDRSNSIDGFNSWMKGVYQLLQEKCKMGFLNLVKQENLDFVTSDECPDSSLSVQEVNEILGVGESIPATLSDEDDMDMPLDL